jgi:hypothetical protein
MKLGKSFFGIAMFLTVAVMVSAFFLQDAQAFPGERGVRFGRGEREGGFAEGPRGGAAVEGPNGGVVVRGPEGNVGVGRAVGDRVAFLPDSASPVIVGGQTYFVDDGGVYYIQCEDDDTSFCVVPNPQ